jgi:hypothetical protein
MEQYTDSISLLLQHAERFFEIWNFQVLIAVAAVGFIMSNEGLTLKDRVRVNITILFLLIAMFSVYTLSIHHERETLVWNAIQSRIETDPLQLTPAELEYIEALKPDDFFRKAAALVSADLFVIAITWISPRLRKLDDGTFE